VEKVKFRKFATESEKFSEIGGGNLKQGEMHHCLRGMDARDSLQDIFVSHGQAGSISE